MEAAATSASLVKEPILVKEGYDLVGAAMEVYNQLGAGFLEGVYQEALEVELGLRNIPFSAQQTVNIFYKGRALRNSYRPDLIVFGQIVCELKVVRTLSSNEVAQILNYLKCSKLRVGYLLNFGWESGLEWKRVIL